MRIRRHPWLEKGLDHLLFGTDLGLNTVLPPWYCLWKPAIYEGFNRKDGFSRRTNPNAISLPFSIHIVSIVYCCTCGVVDKLLRLGPVGASKSRLSYWILAREQNAVNAIETKRNCLHLFYRNMEFLYFGTTKYLDPLFFIKYRPLYIIIMLRLCIIYNQIAA